MTPEIRLQLGFLWGCLGLVTVANTPWFVVGIFFLITGLSWWVSAFIQEFKK